MTEQDFSQVSVLEAEVAELKLELDRLRRLPDKVGERCWKAQMEAENNLRLLKLMEQERDEVLAELDKLRNETREQSFERLGCNCDDCEYHGKLDELAHERFDRVGEDE